MEIKEIKELKNFTFVCHFCGETQNWDNQKINEEIKKFKSWNYSDEDIEEFFTETYGNLCDDCAEE